MSTVVESDLRELYLQPGEVQLVRQPTLLKTILGSCVGVTFWSPRLGLGALCHGVLPIRPAEVEDAEGYRYVDFAIRDLVSRLEVLGAQREEIEIKVFGGSDVLPVFTNSSARGTVGAQNCQTAWAVLLELGLTILAFDTGGPSGRAIQFDTGTGEVLVRMLGSSYIED